MERVVNIVLLVLLTALLSCQKEVEDGAQRAGEKVSLSYTIAEMGGGTYSSSVSATADERSINNVLLLFFSSSDKTYKGYAKVDDCSPSTTVFGSIDYVLPTSVKKTDKCDVLVFANYMDYVMGGDVDQWLVDCGVSLSTMISEVDMNLKVDAGRDFIAKKLPMYGKIEDGLASALSVELTRQVAKVVVTLSSSVSNFTLQGAHMYNASSVCHPVTGTSSGEVVDLISLKSKVVDGDYIELYTFPRGTSTVAAQNDNNTSCIIVKGSYNGSSSSTYYRINFALTSRRLQSILPNKYYSVQIDGVAGDGYSSPALAKGASDSKISYTLGGIWGEPLTGGVVKNGTDELSVSERRVELSFEKDASRVIEVSSNNVVNISKPTGFGWLDWSYASGKLTISTSSANFSTSGSVSASDREGYVNVTAGSITIPIKVIQKGLRAEDKRLEVWGATEGVLPNLNFANAYEGGSVQINVKTSGNSIGSSSVNLKLNGTSYTGSEWSFSSTGNVYNLSFPAQPNTTSTLPRVFSFEIKSGDGLTRNISLVQPARPATLTMSLGDPDGLFSRNGDLTGRTFEFNTSYGGFAAGCVTLQPSGSGFALAATPSIDGNKCSFAIKAEPQYVYGAPRRAVMVTVAAINGQKYTFKLEQEAVVVASGTENVKLAGSSVYWFNRNDGAASSLYYINQKGGAAGTNYDATGFASYSGFTGAVCPPGYRLPVKQELDDLAGKIKTMLVTDIDGSSYNVYYADGTTSTGLERRVFFPIAGHNGLAGTPGTPATTSDKMGNYGCWWSSTIGDTDGTGWRLEINNAGGYVMVTEGLKEARYAVRCVK